MADPSISPLSEPAESAEPAPSQPDPAPRRRCVMVCQYRSCDRNGSAAVMAAFKAAAVPNVLVSGSECMGQCSSGPTVRVMPDNVWYRQLTPEDVAAIATQHLQHNQPVKHLLHPRFHPQ